VVHSLWQLLWCPDALWCENQVCSPLSNGRRIQRERIRKAWWRESVVLLRRGGAEELAAALAVWPAARTQMHISWARRFYLWKGAKYYIIILTYKNQKWVWTAKFGWGAGFRENPGVSEGGPNSISKYDPALKDYFYKVRVLCDTTRLLLYHYMEYYEFTFATSDTVWEKINAMSDKPRNIRVRTSLHSATAFSLDFAQKVGE